MFQELPSRVAGLILNHARQVLRLGDPPGHFRFTGQRFDNLLRAVHLSHFGRQVGRIGNPVALPRQQGLRLRQQHMATANLYFEWLIAHLFTRPGIP